MKFEPGTIIGGRYVISREIASGGMGTVYAVVNRETGHRYALKVLSVSGESGKSTLERFRREAQLLDSLEHHGVVKMTDAGIMKDGSAFLVMELLEGETLLDFFRREAPIDPRRMLPIVRGAADALDAVHAQGVIHRDLKPSNVFTTPDGIKLVDFGVAYGVDLVSLTITGQVVGTVRYMAPEQLDGKRELDARADVYSLGVMVWAALAGRPPHGGNVAQSAMSIMEGTPRLLEHCPGIAPRLADVVQRSIALDPDERYPTAGAFADAFEEALGREPAPAEPHLRWTRERTGFVPLPPTRVTPSSRPGPKGDAGEDDQTEVDPRPLGARRGRRVVAFVIASAVLLGVSAGVVLYLLKTS